MAVSMDYVKRSAVASITTIFKNEPEAAQDNDKLVDLFRNRVELKKEFAALRNEKYQLQDRVKSQCGATERVQQKLNHLESLLLDPEWVHSVVAYYQLRRLAMHCEAKLVRFSEQLKQQREQKVHSKVLVAWNEERKKDSAKIQAQVGEYRMQVQMLEDQLQSERHELATMGGIAKVFRGRSQAASVDRIQGTITEAQASERELLRELEQIGHLEPPPHQGLEISAKRSINFMIIAFAQQLYLDYDEDNLVGLAKEAREKSVGAINYGGRADCDALLQRLDTRREELEKTGDFAELLKKRAKLIAKHAMFRHDDDAVPVPGTVATVFDISPSGSTQQLDANLLGENYFGITKVLSR